MAAVYHEKDNWCWYDFRIAGRSLAAGIDNAGSGGHEPKAGSLTSGKSNLAPLYASNAVLSVP